MQTDLNSMEKFGEAKSRRADEIGTVGYKMVCELSASVSKKNRNIFRDMGRELGKMARPWLSRDERLFTGQRFPFNGYTWLALCGRMPFSRHVRDVCLRRTGMKSSDKLRWDEWEEFRQDRSHPQYRGHLLLPCTPRKKKKKKKKPILRRGNAEGEDRRGGGGGVGGGKIVGIVIRWRL